MIDEVADVTEMLGVHYGLAYNRLSSSFRQSGPVPFARRDFIEIIIDIVFSEGFVENDDVIHRSGQTVFFSFSSIIFPDVSVMAFAVLSHSESSFPAQRRSASGLVLSNDLASVFAHERDTA